MWSIAAVAALGVALPAHAATTTAETGPLAPHTPQTYRYDFGTRALTNATTGKNIMSGFDSGKCPVLFPGDAVETVEEPTVDNGEARKGFGFMNDDDYPNANRYDSRGPIQVTGYKEWGGVPYITSFVNAGDKPVLVWANTCSTASSERVTDDLFHDYLMYDLNFVIYPSTMDVRYECLGEDGAALADEDLATAAYYTDEENPTLFYAEDALANRWSGNDYTYGVTVHRPYIEGYRFVGSTHDWKCWTTIFEVYGADDGWKGNATEIYPQWRGSSHDTQALNGKPEDHLLMQFNYAPARTLTLDAMGGTIDDSASRIYEIEDESFDAKAMDEALAAGTAWVPVRKGFKFAGWYLDEACTKPMKSFEAVLAAYEADGAAVADRACHLYADWREVITFDDVDPTDALNHGDDVSWLAEKGISRGWEVNGGRQYRGLENVSRCDVAAFLFRMTDLADNGAIDGSAALTAEEMKATFAGLSDCSLGTDHAAEVAWMVKNGISQGWRDEEGHTVSFRPTAKVTRQDMAAFLYRFADLQDDGSVNGSPAKGSAPASFSDVAQGDAANHANEVQWLASVGVAKGWEMQDGSLQFRGADAVTRQDMAAFMKRLYDYLG